MIINFNDYGEPTIDLDSLSFWISSGEGPDQHTPTGARVEIDHENVYIAHAGKCSKTPSGLDSCSARENG